METNTQFVLWLKDKKNYTDRTISDIFSRIKRAQQFLPNRELDRYFITDLDLNPAFKELPKDIQSQIRSAIRLRQTFINLEDQNNE